MVALVLVAASHGPRLFLGGSGAFGRWGERARPRSSRLAATGPAEGELTLRYFDGRGVAEVSRMLFAVAGESYEDKRYPITFGTPGDFSTLKRPEFDADKAAGKMTVAMGKLPVLDAGPSFSLPQSKAIERYLAKRFGMMGATPEEEAWVDAVAEHVKDINDAYNKKGLFFMKDAEKKAELEKTWFDEELPPMLEKLDAAIPGVDGCAVGGKASLADVVIFKLLKDTYPRDVADLYAGLPKLKAIVASLEEHDSLKAWIAERPKTMF